MRFFLYLSISFLLAFGQSVPLMSISQTADRIPSEEIADAISVGVRSDIAPYSLRSIFPRANDPAAVIYTPFVRIASKARQAVAAGRPYGPDDVDAETAAALVHVVMSADALIPVEGLTENDPLTMAVVRAADQRLLHSGEAVLARAVFEHRERLEPKLPRSRSHGVVVGAFERAQLCGGCYVVGFRMRVESGGHREILSVWARITADDVSSWR